ncbi:hypothetical protein OMA37_000514 [Vibrio fluvialis]|nr:hypothetical protein [Vibrio fluvialis]
MSNINPIDKFTDPTFTESAKGLMTLFCIGAVHTVLGVELVDAEIAVPWFPTVIFNNPKNLIYLYWGMTFYAIYRYCLHNATIIRSYWFDALLKGLKSPSGASFISKTIWLSDGSYEVTRRSKGNNDIDIIGYFFIDSENPREQIQENVYYFTFKYSEQYQFQGIECSSSPDYEVKGACFSDKNIASKWGLNRFWDEDRDLEEFKGDFIKSKTYRFRLFRLRLIPYVFSLLSSKTTFDLMLPILLNILLFFSWILVR